MMLVTERELQALQDLPPEDFKLYFLLRRKASQERSEGMMQLLNEKNPGMARLEAAGLVSMINNYAYTINEVASAIAE